MTAGIILREERVREMEKIEIFTERKLHYLYLKESYITSYKWQAVYSNGPQLISTGND